MSSNQPSSTRAALKNTFGSIRHKPPKEVPAGTVASRISYLQSLAGGGSRKSPTALKPNNTVRSKPSPKQVNDVDADRAGFGRRTSARFGYPAQPNDSPAEDPHEGKSGHRIMGWQIKRTKHETDSDNKSIKSNSSSKKGFRAKVKDVFNHSDRQEQGGESPEIVSVNTRTVSISVGKREKDFTKDFSWETEREAKPVYPPSSTAVAPSRRITVVAVPPAPGPPLAKVASRDFAEEALISGHKVHNWLAEAHSDSIGGSEDSVSQSVATTSTGRVRSVQQMYSSYGIPEPSELFSQALPPSRVVAGEPRRCHICKWINVGVERCSCCGHRLCAECAIETNPKSKASMAAETARLLLETDDEVNEEEEEEESTYSRYSISQLPHRTEIEFKEENWVKATPTARKRSSRQSPMSLKPPAKPSRAPVFEERFDLPQKNPSVALVHPYASGDGTSPPRLMSIVPAALYQPLKEQRESLTRSPPIPPEVVLEYARTLSPPRMLAAPGVVKAHKKSIVKDSPFLRTDQTAGNRTKQKLKRVTHKGAQHVHPSTTAPPPSESSLKATAHPDTSGQFLGTQLDDDMSSVKCDSPTCRATHTGHRPYRHSISCSWKKVVAGADTAPTTPTSPKDVVKTLQMSPLMPKPLSPVKRKTDEMKSLAAMVAEPVVVSVITRKMVKENSQVKKVSAEFDAAPGTASPYSKAVVSVLATKTELISPMGSDGHEDEHQAEPPAAATKLHPSASSTRKTRSKRGRSKLSSSGSYSPTITSTGQITTIYETSIIEHPVNSRRGPRTHGRRPHRRSQYAPFSFSSDTPRPTRSSAERSHEERLRRKHKAHPATTFGFCPTTPHTHIIEHSTEYIECHQESQSMENHNMDNHRDIASNNTTTTQATRGLSNEWRELKRQERGKKVIARAESSRHNVTKDSIDHGTFMTTRTHRKTNPINNASDCVPRALEPQDSDSEADDTMNNRQPANGDTEDDSHAQGYGGRLKQLGDSVVHRGNSVLKKGWDARDLIVPPRMRLADKKRLMEEQKKRAKYGDMDPSLMDSGKIRESKYDTLGQPRHASSESDNDIHPSIEVSETSDEPEPSTRRRYLERRQTRPDQQQRGKVHYRKDGVTHSRDMDHNRDSLDNLSTQPSFGTEYRHQSHPAQRHRRDSGTQTHHQSFAGHEISHRNTGLLYSDSSSDSYFDENHSTMSGMSREIVFESGPHGKGAAVLPVLEDEGRYNSGSDLEREQSRKVNRAGLRVSKSVRHIVGAAGPVVPVAMPVAVEDNAIPAVPAVPQEDIDMAEQERSVNRAGLRMSNSVRHIVGADGSASFSITSAQPNAPLSSTHGSQSSTDASGCQAGAAGMGVPRAPKGPRAWVNWDSYRPQRSDTPSPSSGSTRNLFRSPRYRQAFEYSHRQTSPLEEESDRNEPAPSREQPYYFASAPGLRTSEEERTRQKSFSASKLSLFDKLQNAEPKDRERGMGVYEGTSSVAVPARGQGAARVREPSNEASEEGEIAEEPAQESSAVPRGDSNGKSKRRMDDAPRADASKRRKLSENKVASPAMAATTSFFNTMRGKSTEAVVSETRTEPSAAAAPVYPTRPTAAVAPSGPSVPSHPSVQSLKEMFSLPTPDSSNTARSSTERSSSPEKAPKPAPNPFRRQRREQAIQNLMDLVEEDESPNPSKVNDSTVAKRSALPAASAAFSVDGARSRINTVSTQLDASLLAVREASVSRIASSAQATSTPAAKAKTAKGRFMTPTPAAMAKGQYEHLSAAASSPTDDEDVFTRHERNLAKEKNTSVAPTLVSATPEPPALPTKHIQGNLISKQAQKCQLCAQVVLKSGMDAHVEKCAEEIVKAEMRKEREAKEKKRAQKDKMDALARKHMGDAGSEDVIVFESPPSANVRSKSLKARLAQKTGGKSKSLKESGDTAEESAKSKQDALADLAAGAEPINATPAKKGEVSEIAKKFQQPPPGQHSANAIILARKTTTPPSTAISTTQAPPKKVLALGGTDGASSAAPLMTYSGKKAVARGGPNLDEMPIEVSMWIADKFGIEPTELGEVLI